MTKTISLAIVFTTFAAVIAALYAFGWNRTPTPERIVIKRDIFACKDRLYFEMLVRSLTDDTLAYSDEGDPYLNAQWTVQDAR